MNLTSDFARQAMKRRQSQINYLIIIYSRSYYNARPSPLCSKGAVRFSGSAKSFLGGSPKVEASGIECFDISFTTAISLCCSTRR